MVLPRTAERALSGSALRNRFLALVCVGAVAGCNEHPLDHLGETQESVGHETSPQIGSNAVDIVWGIDGSPPMREAQSELGARFDGFIAALGDLNADFHMAVVTTDLNDGGLTRVQPGPI